MDLFEELPYHLNANKGVEVPAHIVIQLKFLWLSAYQQIQLSKEISHQFSRKFAFLIQQYSIVIPETVSSKLCKHCYILQIPTLTCQLRVRKLSKKKQNLSSKNNIKFRNKLVRHCLSCQKNNLTKECCQKKEKQVISKVTENTPIISKPVTPMMPSSLLGVNKKHSFLDSMTKKPRNSVSSLDSTDFISLSSISNSFGSPSTSIMNNINNKRVSTLLEREALQKNQRKKR